MLEPPQSVVVSEQLGAAAGSLGVVVAPLGVGAVDKRLAAGVVVHTLVVQAVLVALVVGPRQFGVGLLVQLPQVRVLQVLVQLPVQALEQPLRKINYRLVQSFWETSIN